MLGRFSDYVIANGGTTVLTEVPEMFGAEQLLMDHCRDEATFEKLVTMYSLRQEANNDILKIYFQKDKGEFFAKSVKFKYPRQRKTVVADGVGQGYKEVQEISPNLRYIIDELDQICQRDRSEVDLKRKKLPFCRRWRLHCFIHEDL